MRILLASYHVFGAWFLLRLIHEGHKCEWFLIDPENKEEERIRPHELRILKGLIPPPLDKKPKFSNYDLVLFDNTGHGDLAEEARKETPVIGDGHLATELEDNRLFGIETMEQCGIEVPDYETFDSVEDATAYIEEFPRRYVYKPFNLPGMDAQDSGSTYVSDSAEDMLKCLQQIFKDSQNAPFLLQEVVEGTEIATNGYFDGHNFHFVTHTIEEKKFMSHGYGPNTHCSGNLIINPRGSKRLVSEGLQKLVPFLRDSEYRGMIDLNTIVNEQHIFGLEFTPRFGYDSSATEFSMLDGDLGKFLFDIATGPVDHDPVPPIPYDFAAACRYSVPPYPEELAGKHPRGMPIKGVSLDDAWRNFYLYDAMLDKRDGKDELCTAGITGFVGCAIGRGYSADSAWDSVDRIHKGVKIPDMQLRCDLREVTIRKLKEGHGMGWI